MKTTAVRLYGARDLRLESFELSEIAPDEILASVVTDTMCMSSWKLAMDGENHKKTPPGLATNPIIIGHETCGEIIRVGADVDDRFQPGQKYILQPNMGRSNSPYVPGYSYPYLGGDATYVIIAPEVIDYGCILPFAGRSFYEGSLTEPLSCVITAFDAQLHVETTSPTPSLGIRDGGTCAILAGTGPMGLLAIDYALHGDRRPSTLVVTGRREASLDRVRRLYSSDTTRIEFVNVGDLSPREHRDKVRAIAPDGFDDVFCMIPDADTLEVGGDLLAPGGCLNFFAGPMAKDFRASLNFYDVHYNRTHITGTSGGLAADSQKAADLIAAGRLDVAKVVTHVLGLDHAIDTTLDQPHIGGGKKLVYTHHALPRLTLSELTTDSELGRIVAAHDGIWSADAEQWLLNNAPTIQ